MHGDASGEMSGVDLSVQMDSVVCWAVKEDNRGTVSVRWSPPEIVERATRESRQERRCVESVPCSRLSFACDKSQPDTSEPGDHETYTCGDSFARLGLSSGHHGFLRLVLSSTQLGARVGLGTTGGRRGLHVDLQRRG